MWSRRLTRALLSLRLLAVYSLGATVISVPLTGFDLPSESGASLARPIAAVVAAADGGFLLDRDGHVIRVSGDGSPPQLVASIGRRSTPFGTAAGDQVVFGGIRCEKGRCPVRVAEVVVLDGDGHVEASVTLRRWSPARGTDPADVAARPVEPPDLPTPTAASALDGLALVGRDEGHLWLNAGGTLFQVDVSSASVVAEVPWSGGEPCVIDGVLHDLVASGGTLGEQGADLASTSELDLRMHAWDGSRWRRVIHGDTAMTYGQNAYCSPDGYEIHDGRRTLARWERGTGWRRATSFSQLWRPQPGWLGPLTTSTGTRYAVMADGSVLDITGTDPARPTGVVIPGLAGSGVPPAVQLDDAGGQLFWCATTYRPDAAVARCGGADWASPGEEAWVDGDSPGAGSGAAVRAKRVAASEPSAAVPEVHHYNLCSSACGDGVRSHSRDVVTWLVRQHDPAALSLNELCYDDSVHLAGRLPASYRTGASYVALGTTTGCPGAIKQFGNQIRVMSGGNGEAWWGQFPTQAAMPCDHRVQECRGVACAETDDGDQRRVFCSTHLETPRRDPDVPGRQVQEYLEVVTDRYGDRRSRIVLAGDFNVEPADADAVLAPEGYVQTVTAPTVDGHRPPASKQIDLVYHREPTLTPATAVGTATQAATTPATGDSQGVTYCDIQASDHCYVVAPLHLHGFGALGVGPDDR